MVDYWHEFPGNFSGGQQVTGLGSFFQYLNDVTNITNSGNGGALGFIILWVMWGVAFFTVRGASTTTKAFASASFVAFALGIFLVRIEILSTFWVMTMAIFAVMGGIAARGEARLGL